MAIDVFTKAWAGAPTIGSSPITGHPLCPQFGFLFDGVIQDIVRGARGVSSGATAGLWTTNSAKGYPGKSREHSATTDRDDLGLDTLLLPLRNASFVLGYQKTDAVNRGSTAFGTQTGTTNTCDAYIPFSDAITYWDFGGTGGGNRISVGGLTFGDDIWAFTTGFRGMEIWQNGILRQSNANDSTRANTGSTFSLGKNNSQTSDLARWKFLWVYHRQLTLKEIAEITRFPYRWVAPRS